jgi:carbon monoxide dehydrogenase subunit G
MLLMAAVILGALVSSARPAIAADADPAWPVTVRHEDGVYSVTARFRVPGPPAAARAVLIDYEQIPRFLPDIKISIVRERGAGRVIVEQEAVSHMMMFSRRVHLLLEITEDADMLRFVDRCGASFERYSGSWRLTARNGGTEIAYELTAKPVFTVPEFLLERLLKRDAVRMIDRLAREMAARRSRGKLVGRQ